MKSRPILIGTLLATLFFFVVSSITQSPDRKVTGHFLAMTNGTIGPMTALYSRFSTKNAANIREWSTNNANVAVVRVTNNLPRAINLFPYCTVESRSSLGHKGSLLVDSTPYGIWLPAGAATNVEVAIFIRPKHPWRLELQYTRDPREDSFIQNFQRVPRDLYLFLTRQRPMVVEPTIRISTDWISPP